MSDPTASDPIREAHPETVCQRCGGPNDVWSAPNDLWNAVMGTPDNPRGEGLIVCWSCFLAALSDTTPDPIRRTLHDCSCGQVCAGHADLPALSDSTPSAPTLDAATVDLTPETWPDEDIEVRRVMAADGKMLIVVGPFSGPLAASPTAPGHPHDGYAYDGCKCVCCTNVRALAASTLRLDVERLAVAMTASGLTGRYINYAIQAHPTTMSRFEGAGDIARSWAKDVAAEYARLSEVQSDDR